MRQTEKKAGLINIFLLKQFFKNSFKDSFRTNAMFNFFKPF